MECTTAMQEVGSLYEHLKRVTDRRCRRGRRYEAAKVLVIILLAKLAGEESISGIAEWARLRGDWLKEALGLGRLPCANTYTYISSHVDVEELNGQLRTYFAALNRHLKAEAEQAGKEAEQFVHWAVDGKVLRGSACHSPPGRPGQELLHVYAVEAGYLEDCQMIAGKGYEAATAQAFVAAHDCAGKVITADALHTRPRFCRQIRRQQGEYLLVVKRNRPELEAEIRHLFALPADPRSTVQQVRTVDSGHGRVTIRQLSASSELNLALAGEWRDLAQVFLLERWVTNHHQTTYESLCGITSLTPAEAAPAKLLALLRAHWHIENRCHWRRDATLGEDRCTVRQPHVATLLAMLNSAILALFDHLKITNARKARRSFNAYPQQALDLLF
jgi:predicted transposase YbfD/YdcC